MEIAEMTTRQRIIASAQRKRADKLPFFHYWRHCQVGWAERECRNRGMGINWARPPYTTKMHSVEISETQANVSGQTVIRRTYSTPVGSIYEEEKREPGVGQWHGLRSWRDVLPWQTEHLIKRPEDYKVLKYIVENTEYIADYFPIEQALDWLGEDGVVIDDLPYSPMQMLMINWIGSDGGRFYFHHADYPDLVEDLYETISKSIEPLYEIAAKSPAPIALCGDNLDGLLVTPELFKKYFMPEYEKQARVLHKHGKLMAVHMDGRLNLLKNLIAETPIDIIEGFHPPPMGDLSVTEALSLWPNKVIWIGFPGSEYFLGPEATKKCALNLLREADPGDRLAVAMSTENIVSNENLRILTDVLEKAYLPLARETIDHLEKEGHLPLEAGPLHPFSRDQENTTATQETLQPLEDIDFELIHNDIFTGDLGQLKHHLEELLEDGINAQNILQQGLISAMKVIGEKFKANDVFIPEVLLAARAMNEGVSVLGDHLVYLEEGVSGKILIGTVKGDLHDIGKNLVGIMLSGAGYEVRDIGIDVPADEFVKQVKEYQPDIIGLSALLTTTLPEMETVIEALKAKGLREGTKVIVGGAPVNDEFAHAIGADGYAPDAGDAINLHTEGRAAKPIER